MKKNNSPFNAFFGFIIFMALMNGGIGSAIPLLIFYFVVRSIMSKNPNTRQRNQNRRVPNTKYNTDRERARREADLARQRAEQTRRAEIRRRTGIPKKTFAKRNPFKKSGITKFKDYDYKGAIEDFEKALTIEPGDNAVHFNLAAAYSLDEKVDKAYFHLDKAVANGFKDFEKISSHDALAYLRIQPKYEAFKANGFRLGGNIGPKKTEAAEGIDANLLEQLNRLQELREKGVLTEEEFVVQKKKILR